MKKTISIAAIALLIFSALALAACGSSSSGSAASASGSASATSTSASAAASDSASAASASGSAAAVESKYVGTWETTNMTLKDQSESLDGTWKLEIYADGTGKSIDEAEEAEEFTWQATNNGFKTKGGLKLTFTDEGDGFKTKLLGVEIHFVRVA